MNRNAPFHVQEFGPVLTADLAATMAPSLMGPRVDRAASGGSGASSIGPRVDRAASGGSVASAAGSVGSQGGAAGLGLMENPSGSPGSPNMLLAVSDQLFANHL
jgi:hypothetical protein